MELLACHSPCPTFNVASFIFNGLILWKELNCRGSKGWEGGKQHEGQHCHFGSWDHSTLSPPLCVLLPGRDCLIPIDRGPAEVTSVLHTNSFCFLKNNLPSPFSDKWQSSFSWWPGRVYIRNSLSSSSCCLNSLSICFLNVTNYCQPLFLSQSQYFPLEITFQIKLELSPWPPSRSDGFKWRGKLT